MNVSFETKLEYQSNLKTLDYNDNIVGEDLISNNIEQNEEITPEIIKSNEIEIEEIEEIVDELLINKSKHLFFTNILNEQKKQKNRKEYLSWLNNNYEMLQSAYYILSSKYFNNVNFEKFSEFCFLYY
jgi:hypothetical protein